MKSLSHILIVRKVFKTILIHDWMIKLLVRRGRSGGDGSFRTIVPVNGINTENGLWSGGDGSFRTTDPVNGINTENGLSVSYISSNPNSENHFVPPEFRLFPLYNKGAP